MSRELVLAVLIPAAVAAALVRLFFPAEERAAPVHLPVVPAATVDRLAAAATRPAEPTPLRPIVVAGGHPALGDASGPLVEPRRPAPPAAITIPALGLHAPVDAVAATATGIAVPRRGRAGWYDAGPRPGEAGRAVVIGHLDSPTGADVFGRVPLLRHGAKIVVGDARGKVHLFRVVGKLEVEKRRFPSDAVYGPARRPVLVLVTCGGPYIPGFGYRDNVIVFARGASA